MPRRRPHRSRPPETGRRPRPPVEDAAVPIATRRTWQVAVFVLAGITMYAASLSNAFVWDDIAQVLQNHLAHSLANIRYFFQGGTFATGGAPRLGGIYYRPLMTTSFALLYGLFGPVPFYFHLYQLAFHLTNGVLVLLLFERWLTRVEPEGAGLPPAARFLPLALALVFVVHPMN